MIDSPKQVSNSMRLNIPRLHSPSANVTPSIVHKIHQKQLQNNENNEHNMKQLVNIFGGIDAILNHYLIETTLLSYKQLEQIQQLITTPREFQQQSTLKLSKKNSTNIHRNNSIISMEDFKQNGQQLVYYFYTKNTMFNQIFCTKMSQFACIANNDIIWIFGFLLFAFRLFEFTQNVYDEFWRLLFRYVFGIYWILFLFVIIMNMNKKAIWLTMKSFAWWLKLYFSIQFAICWILYFYFTKNNNNNNSIQFNNIDNIDNIHWFISDIICNIGYIVCVASIGLIPDCINTPSRNTRIICSFIAALSISWIAIYYTFIHKFTVPPPILTLFNDYEITLDLVSLMTSSARTMTLFVWRMVFAMILGKNKCIMIRYHPYNLWTDIEPQRMRSNSINDKGNTPKIQEVINGAETMMEMQISTRGYNVVNNHNDDDAATPDSPQTTQSPQTEELVISFIATTNNHDQDTDTSSSAFCD